MDGSLPAAPAMLDSDSLAALMPMHLWIGERGEVRSVGPTLAKICGPDLGAGARFDVHFRILKPQLPAAATDAGAIPDVTSLRAFAGRRLHVAAAARPETVMRGHAVPLPVGQGVLMNLSFGIAATRAVRDHALTSADFAPTDLTVELLYLAEAKTAVMSELAALNGRIESARQMAEVQALSDALTGLANRRAFVDALAAAVSAARRGQPFALVHLDLDFFKAVNDTLGHAAGDLVLRSVAAVLRAETRRHDLVARVGGDEFVMILRGPVTSEVVAGLAARIISALERPIPVDGRVAQISGSLGATFSNLYARPVAEQMLTDADVALYASKRLGRRRATIFTPGMVAPDDPHPGSARV